MILDLFPANILVLNTRLQSNYWDLDKKWRWWFNNTCCPIKGHLKVIVVVDEDDDEEEDKHVSQITCTEFLSEEFRSLK